jgi:hypothetical protein
MTFRESLERLFRRRRPMTREDAAQIASWVNEGGSFDPTGPPRVIDDDPDDRQRA